jgi:menaquinone-9 beta-reductase
MLTAGNNNPEQPTREVPVNSDVVIVGAGPAGAATAYYLASKGVKVTLLDKASFPREKTAGDFVSPVAIAELQKMNITNLTEFNKITHATIFLSGKRLVSGSFPSYPDTPNYSQVVPRIVLDGLMVNAARNAGALFLDQFSVSSFNVENDVVTVTGKYKKEVCTLKCRLLIGADGHNSMVARTMRGGEWPESNKAIVVRGYFENVSGSPSQANVFYNGESLPGYSWIFPIDKSRANVGVGVVLEASPPPMEPKELFEYLIKNDEGMKSRLENATLKGDLEVCFLNMYDPQMPLVKDRFMLVGEAAGLVNGFNGEGNQFALVSGRWAAEVASTCLERGDLSQAALYAYQKQVEDNLGYGFKTSNLMLQMIRNRSFNPAWLKALEIMGEQSKVNPEYAKITSGILCGVVFPDQETTAKIMVGIMEEAVISTGAATFAQLINDPLKLPENAVKFVKVGFDMTRGAMEDPLDFLNWAVGNASKMAQLAVELRKEFIE